jgi:hypothetical protein
LLAGARGKLLMPAALAVRILRLVSRRLVCPVCGDVVGVYERLLVITGGSARVSSLAGEPSLRSGEQVVVHHTCGADLATLGDDEAAAPSTVDV